MEPTWFSYKSFHRLLTLVNLLICFGFLLGKVQLSLVFFLDRFFNFESAISQYVYIILTIQQHRVYKSMDYFQKTLAHEVIIKVGNNATLEKISTHCEKYSNFTRFFIRKFLMEEWLAVSSCLCPLQVTQPIKTLFSS